MYEVKITEGLLNAHKLTEEDCSKIEEILKRQPNLVELGIFSAMWSEHCSYKTTRIHLKNMYTKGEQVICGPGENAGIIDGLDDDAIIFKMESHNHPSFIEPFSGAATGVGGILRDVFTMGARPIANVNSLRFGNLHNKHTKRLVKGVTSGISFYGNCVGVPMVTGECTFDDSYNGNVLVNAMAVGVAKKDKIFYSAASFVGANVIYVGNKTGRDGVGGASMSSDSFSSEDKTEKSTVQVGDPFVEKLLIEACLELMQTDCVLAIQDMGAAGLTCSSVEMAEKGNTGIELNLDAVPKRATGMNAYEIMLSESQERMLIVIKQGKEDEARKIFEKWDLDFAIIGKITDTKHLILKEGGQVVCDIPIEPVTSNSPLYDRPSTLKIESEIKIKTPKIKESEIIPSLLKILSSPNIASKEFIYQKYDSGVQNRAFFACGNQSGVVRYGREYEIVEKEEGDKNFMLSQIMLSKKGCGALNFLHNTNANEIKYTTQKALVISSTCTPKFVKSNPVNGAIHAVVEGYRNICATGGKPSALTNCLNFGNPTNPEVMGQIKGAIEGISTAAKALNTPVISGNVSLYNETDGNSINPTPTIGMVGIMQDYTKAIPNAISNEEQHIFLIGDLGYHLTNTTYAEVCEGVHGGAIPNIDLNIEKQTGEFLQKIIDERILFSCGDISHGGLLTALAKMCVKGGVGANINLHHVQGTELVSLLFNEDNARYICTVPKDRSIDFINKAIENNIIYTQIGFTTGKSICVNSVHEVSIEECKKALSSLAEFFAG
jgi:phosphoribosylformylglycinamidine (FGAM) synthase-like enzyme